MSFSRINNKKLWRERAAEARAIANLIFDPGAKEKMLRVADAYEEMAQRAEEGTVTQRPGQSSSRSSR
jgi:hypothetical protein